MTKAEIERARRVAVRAQLLDGSATTVLDTVQRLGFLQMDPIATVAPPQHLVLYNRVDRYDPAELDRLVWEERSLIEWNAFLWPVEDLPVLRARMKRHRTHQSTWMRRHMRENAAFRRKVLRELEHRGPSLSRDLDVDEGPPGEKHAWWGSRRLRLALEVLTVRGEVAVAGRQGKQRVWDIAERVYPECETIPWGEAERRIEERRRRSLGVWLERGKLHVHPDISDEPVGRRVAFLSPFDRLIHDRNRAEALWGFFYRLEMYVPKAKRQYGYYVLPILRGDRVVGRIDVERDKAAGGLKVNGVWWEAGAKPFSLEPALKRLAAWVRSSRPDAALPGDG